MRAEVVLLPGMLDPHSLKGKAAVVFDVLRATTTITAALAAGVRSVRAFAELSEAEEAAKGKRGARPILCGEVKCLPPAGFDLGNSPRQFVAELHAGREIFLATSNGTKALAAARSAAAIFTEALVNASAAAEKVLATGMDVVLVCAGTNGQIAMEDVIGAGAVLSGLKRLGNYEETGDAARMATILFEAAQSRLPEVLRDSQGGRNIIAAGLEEDIDFAARLDVIDIVGRVEGEPMVIRGVGN